MAADDETRAVTRRQLDRLISYQGRAKVREILGVDDGMLTSLLDGSLDWPADARERFDRAWGLMVHAGSAWRRSPTRRRSPARQARRMRLTRGRRPRTWPPAPAEMRSPLLW